MAFKKNSPGGNAAMGIGCCCNSCTAYGTDNFDRADNTNISTGSTVGWTESSGAWAIVSNTLQCTTAGIALCNTTHPDGDFTMIVEVDFSHTNNGSSVEVIAACHDSSEFYAARFTVGSSPSISIRTGAGGSLKSVTAGLTIATNTTYRGKICITPEGHCTAYLDGVAKVTALFADMDFGTRTKCGLRGIGSGTATFDNFSVTKSKNTDAATCPECDIAPATLTSCNDVYFPPTPPCSPLNAGFNSSLTLPSNGAEEWSTAILTVSGVGHLHSSPSYATPTRSPLCCVRLNAAYELGAIRSAGVYVPCGREHDLNSDPVWQGGGASNTCVVNMSSFWGAWLAGDGTNYFMHVAFWGLYMKAFWKSANLSVVGNKVMTIGSHSCTFICEAITADFGDSAARCSWPPTIGLDLS